VTKKLLASDSNTTRLANEAELTPATILAAAEKGDPLALKALAEVGRALGIIISACTVILNPSCFVIGGGLGVAGFDYFMPRVHEELTRRTLPNHRWQMDIVRSQVESPAIGSACLVWYALSGKMPER
jgi:glucokinase